MIPRTDAIWQSKTNQNNNWQAQLKAVIRQPEELFARLSLDTRDMPAHLAAHRDFALRVPEHFVSKMETGNWHDPLLLQVLPQAQELAKQPGFISDPLHEAQSNPKPGLIHKYQGRVLLIASGGCAINCRYCFRRHFPYQENNPSREEWRQTLKYIASNDSIHEVILSGGDPLINTDQQLKALITDIANIDHIKTLRIHSRLPLVIPQRITEDFIDVFCNNRLKQVFVAHCNHPNELDINTEEAFLHLKKAGVTLLNQSVLLANINDDFEVLAGLSKRLFEQGVLPYYLHLLDPVNGAAHFDVSELRGKALIEQLRNYLPGYLVPKLVREVANNPSKTPI